MKGWMACLLLQAGLMALGPVSAQVQATEGDAARGNGTLVVQVLPFTSEKELPKKVGKQLRNGALEWGVRDGQLVFTMVAKQFIDFPINHMTRYGQEESLQLPAGDYRVTAVGLELNSSFSVQKVLDKGAYLNEDVLAFRIEPGETTRLTINPVIYRDATFAVNFWMPTLMVRTTTAAGTSPEEVDLTSWRDASIAWPKYQGPLKFVAK